MSSKSVWFTKLNDRSTPVAIPGTSDYESQNSVYNADLITFPYHICGHQKKVCYSNNGDIYSVMLYTTGDANTTLHVYKMTDYTGSFSLFDSFGYAFGGGGALSQIDTFDIAIIRDVIFIIFSATEITGGQSLIFGVYCDLNNDETAFSAIDGLTALDNIFGTTPVILSNDWDQSNRMFLNGIVPFGYSDDSQQTKYKIIHQRDNVGTNKFVSPVTDIDLVEISSSECKTLNYKRIGESNMCCMFTDKHSHVYGVAMPTDITALALSWAITPVLFGNLDPASLILQQNGQSTLSLPSNFDNSGDFMTMDCAYNPFEHKFYYVFSIANDTTNKIEIYCLAIDLDNMNDNDLGDDVSKIASYTITYNGSDPLIVCSPTIGCDNNGTMVVIYEQPGGYNDEYTDLMYVTHPLYGVWSSELMFQNGTDIGEATLLRPRIPRRIRDAMPIVTFDVLVGIKLEDIGGGIAV